MIRDRCPADLRPPEPATNVNGSAVRRIWQRLAEVDELGAARYIFLNHTDFPFDLPFDDLLTGINVTVAAVPCTDSTARTALAQEMLHAWATGDHATSELPLEIAEFTTKFLLRERGLRALCVGESCNTMAIAAMTEGAQTLVYSRRLPVIACVFAALVQSEPKVVCDEPCRNCSPFGRKIQPFCQGRDISM